MISLKDAIESLKKKGYDKNFVIKEDAIWLGTRKYVPETMIIDQTWRIEDDSDPTHQSVVYGVRYGETKLKGTIVAGHGPTSDTEKNEVIQRFQQSA